MDSSTCQMLGTPSMLVQLEDQSKGFIEPACGNQVFDADHDQIQNGWRCIHVLKIAEVSDGSHPPGNAWPPDSTPPSSPDLFC